MSLLCCAFIFILHLFLSCHGITMPCPFMLPMSCLAVGTGTLCALRMWWGQQPCLVSTLRRCLHSKHAGGFCCFAQRTADYLHVVSVGYCFWSWPGWWCESSAGKFDTKSGTKLTTFSLCLVPAVLAFQHWSFCMALRVQSK